MKKIISILLAVVMIFALVSCGAKTEEPAAEPASEPEATEPAAKPAEEPAAEEPAAEPAAEEKTLKIAHIVPSYAIGWNIMLVTAFERMQKAYNFELTRIDVNMSNEEYINQIDILGTQGIDGIIIMCMPEIEQRCYEVASEYGMVVVSDAEDINDVDTGKVLVPGAGFDAPGLGAQAAEWLCENYKTYWGDCDTSKIGFISVTHTSMSTMIIRSDAAIAKFKEYFPDNQTFVSDLLSTGGMDANASLDATAPIVTSHPEIEHWMVVGTQEVYCSGVLRLAEQLDMTNKDMLIFGLGGEEFVNTEIPSGYDPSTGAWVASSWVSGISFAKLEIPAICDLIRGNTTVEELWKDQRKEGEDVTALYLQGPVITADNWKQVIDDEEAEFAKLCGEA